MNFWSWFQGIFRRKKPAEQRILSLVMLLREERYLDAVIVRQLATRAFQVDFDEVEAEDAENDVLRVKDDANYLIRARGETFLVNNYSRPYVEDVVGVSGEIEELRIRQAFLEHCAWVS